IVNNLDGFGVARLSCADGFVLRGLGGPAGVARRCADHAFHVLEHCLNSPEASPRNDGSLLGGDGRTRGIHNRGRNCYRWVGLGAAGRCAENRSEYSDGSLSECRHFASPSKQSELQHWSCEAQKSFSAKRRSSLSCVPSCAPCPVC